MQQAVIDYGSWCLSALTFLFVYLAGIKHRWTWYVSGLNQLCWVYWALVTGPSNHGLIPCSVGLFLMAIWNERKWRMNG